MHLGMKRPERKVGVDFLEAIESGVENSEGAFDYCTFFEGVNVSRVNYFNPLTVLWTGSITRDTFSTIVVLLVWRTRANTGSVVFEQMIWTCLDTCGTISILSFRVDFPGIGRRVVLHHRRTFLFADPVIMEVPAGKAVTLLGTCTSTCTEQVTAFPWVGSEAPALMTLGCTVGLGELLAVVGSFTPTSIFTGVVTGRTCLNTNIIKNRA